MRLDQDHGSLHQSEMAVALPVWLGVPLTLYAVVGGHATLWYLHVPQFLAWHATLSVNSAMHTFGYARPGDETNVCRSRNVPWLWGLSLGEAWHSNHHVSPNSASFEGQWWEVDPVFRLIQLAEQLGLVWNVRGRSAVSAGTMSWEVSLMQMLIPPLVVVLFLVGVGSKVNDSQKKVQ